MAKLYLHIGSGKAGSTSLQNWMFAARDPLNQMGLHYIQGVGKGNHVGFAQFALSDDREVGITAHIPRSSAEMEKWRGDFKKKLVEEVETKAKEGMHGFIASSENLLLDVTSLDEVRRLNELLRETFDQVEVLVFLKRQDLFAVSQHNDAIKGYRCTDRDPFSYIEKTKFINFLEYNKRLDLWARGMSAAQITVRANVDAVTEAADIIGTVDLSEQISVARENAALVAPAMEVIRRLNLLTTKSRKAKLGVWCYHELTSDFGGRGLYPSRQSAEEFLERFSASNDRLRRRWFPASADVFGTDFAMYDETADYEKLRPRHLREWMSDQRVREAIANVAIRGVLEAD